MPPLIDPVKRPTEVGHHVERRDETGLIDGTVIAVKDDRVRVRWEPGCGGKQWYEKKLLVPNLTTIDVWGFDPEGDR